MNTDMIAYYRARAGEYEKVYDKPERQNELREMSNYLQEIFSGKEVFEIACGTGYWTERIAKTTKSIHATDVNEAVLEIARKKEYAPAHVTFSVADIFSLSGTEKYESLFAGFIWSHIPLQQLKQFLLIIHSLVIPGGTVVIIDNTYVDESSSPVNKTDSYGNTYQLRTLEDGSVHSVLKNFPTEKFLHDIFVNQCTDWEFMQLKYYWLVKYQNPMNE